jgi:hypothetical protein
VSRVIISEDSVSLEGADVDLHIGTIGSINCATITDLRMDMALKGAVINLEVTTHEKNSAAISGDFVALEGGVMDLHINTLIGKNSSAPDNAIATGRSQSTTAVVVGVARFRVISTTITNLSATTSRVAASIPTAIAIAIACITDIRTTISADRSSPFLIRYILEENRGTYLHIGTAGSINSTSIGGNVALECAVMDLHIGTGSSINSPAIFD